MLALGEVLGTARKTIGLTQRQVEEATGVSNAYLSQLETGKIKTPSPQILYKLGLLYSAPYETLMELAGYPVPGKSARAPSAAVTQLAARVGDVSPSEADALADYLAFLRQRKSEL